jgi:undecaprenyl-diphosphatase
MDIAIFNAIHSLAGQSGFSDGVGIFFATYLPYIMGIAAIVFIVKQKSWKERLWNFFFIFLTALVSRGLLTELIRFVWARPRPFVFLGFTPLVSESSVSFPSGHATFFFALAFAILYFNKKWGMWFLSLSLIVGLARIFVGVHWPSDILGGFIVAFLSFLAVRILLKKYTPNFEAVQKPSA